MLTICGGNIATAQTYLETYGQNRVQTRKYDWKYFDTEHFRIYHYDAAGRQLARYIAEQAEKDIKMVEQKMRGEFPHRFNIILYNNYDEYRQTNIGRKYDSQLQDVPTGTVDLVGDRLVLYYNGVHKDLRHQLRSGMSRVVMERMIFGESFREMVKNAVLLNLPQWVSDGFIAYVVDGWNTESETEWKNLLQANPRKGFYELAEKQPELAGKAFWRFIAARYGESNVRNVLLTMQAKASLSQGIEMTLGQKIRQTYDSVIAFYNATYAKDALGQEHPDSISKAILEINVPRDNTVIRNIMLSPRGYDVAYVAWKEGEFKVIIQHTKDEQEQSTIVFGGAHDYNEQPDPDYPLLCWSNNGYKLAILYKKNSQTRLRIYNSLKAKLEDYIVPSNRFDRVLGMTFMEDDAMMIFSVIKKSKTDLYQFRIKGSRLTPITNDAWDDIQPCYVSGGSHRGIVFLSNRPEPNINAPLKVNELPTGPMNIFFYDTKTQRKELLQLTNITDGNIAQPIQYGSDNFAYLYDSNGINNKYVVLFGRDQYNNDSAYSLPVTNYTQSIIGHQYNPKSKQVADIIQVGNKYKVYFNPLVIPGENIAPKNLKSTTLSGANNTSVTSLTTAPLIAPSQVSNVQQAARQRSVISMDNPVVLKNGNTFQSEFVQDETQEAKKEPGVAGDVQQQDTLINDEDTAATEPEILSDEDSVLVDSTYVKMRAQPYRLSFKPDFFSVKIDNSVLFNKYQSLLTDLNQPLGGMLTVSLNDMMENHRFTGGIRLPMNFSGMAYLLQYENFTRRVDWSLLFLRTQNTYKYPVAYFDNAGNLVGYNPDQIGKAVTNTLQGSATYPLDRIRSVRLHLALRQDVIHFKAVDPMGLEALQDERTYWTMSRAEYVYDNSISPALNIRLGLRYKVYGEYMYRYTKPGGGFYTLGFDARYYKQLYKNIIFAVRGAYAHSAGNQNVNYVVGGVDNWILAKQSGFPPASDENFAFQSLTTNLRGYKQNARHGDTYGLLNAEVRAPIFTSFIKKPIQSSFIKNMQAIAFIDAGNAWSGWLPLSDNLQKSYVFSYTGQNRQPVYAIVDPGNTGLAVGYGAGLRTMIFGYFLRLDAAWSIEGNPRPIWYFSMGTDF